MALARQFRARGVTVAIGGFHVSGCLSMLKELTPELQEAVDLGIMLYAGEAEEHFESLPPGRPRRHGEADLQLHGRPAEPAGADHPLSAARASCSAMTASLSSFDAGRGCPFQCSFCTIINVQGRKSRWRDADDIERIVRAERRAGDFRFFITDDNFARNRNWEAIFDRMIELRERRASSMHFLIQVDVAGPQDPELHREGRARRLPLRLHRAREHQSGQSRRR